MRKFLFLLMAVVLAIGQLRAQQRTISGRVTNEKGDVVPNASVIIKETNRGTTTGSDGTFSLSIPSTAKTLVVSSVGLAPTETAITSSATYSVVISSTAKSLDEVVVVGYGSQRRATVTGAISTVKPAAIENKPFTSVDKALQGAVPGLQSTSTSGAPGAFTDIRIRGQGSINASNQPLWVIDGIIAATGDFTSNTTTANILSTLNPDDIESISVLKDAAAASIYGSRAANGVIVVTTKKGRAGKTVFSFSAEAGTNSIAYKNDHNRAMTTSEYQSVLEVALVNAGFAGNNAEADAIITDPVNGFGLKTGVNTNWYDVVTRSGSQQQYNLSMSGGTDKTQFYVSGGYFKQQGTTMATDFERYNGSITISHKATDRLTITAILNGAATKQSTPTNGGTFANPVLESYFLLPWYSPYNADGSFKYNDAEFQFPANGGIFNPVIQAAWNHNRARQTQLRGNVTGEYKIIDNTNNTLRFTSRFAGEYTDITEDSYRNPFYGDGFPLGDAFASYRRLSDYTWSNFADYKHTINQDFYFDLKLGYEAQLSHSYLLQAGGQGFPQNLDLQYLASAATPTTALTLPTEATTNSIFSTGDINYRNKYVLSASFRRDGSSVFGANNRWGNFYSVGGSWNVNEEDFMKNMAAFSFVKLRASYGENGNSNGFGFYSSLPLYAYDANYAGLSGSAPTNVGNENLTWEKNAILDIGLDFGILKDRVSGSLEYYDRKTSNLLLFVPFSLTSGFTGQNQNVGAMTNKGVEVSITARPLKLKDFNWDITVNFAHNTNRVTELYGGKPISPVSFQQVAVGHDAQSFYLRQWAGVDPANGDPLWYTDGTRSKTTNVYASAQLALSGQADPKYFGSVTNSFSYKGISVSGQFYYNFGNSIYDIWDRYMNSDGLYLGSFNQLSSQLTSWKNPGDVTNVPKIIYGGNQSSYNHSTRYLYDGKYIRLRDVQLSYQI
ncbi:MAG TPA: SusC/RagA family TonB-linked outer membrane protein, partial [Chitinophagaceae bacterium]